MTTRYCCVLLVFCASLSACDQASTPPVAVETAPDKAHPALLVVPPMPVAVANNAVALVGSTDHFKIYSFMGLLSGKTWREVSSRAFEYDSQRQGWQEIEPVPGSQGRLAGTAQAVAGQIYVMGGYTVAEDGSEVSWPGVYRLDPETNRYLQLAPMPVPVDDTVSAVYLDRYIYLISGWHDNDNVDNVQIYDTRENRWLQATPYPGPPLFGHSGGLVGDQLVICDGVKVVPLPEQDKRDFVMSGQCFQGDISTSDLTAIDWRPIKAHPGAPLYRAAAAGVAGRVVFAGGSGNPYNYNGTGYDGNPSVALEGVLAFEPANGEWITLPPLNTPSMDHRGLLVLDGKALVVGGMDEAQKVLATVQVYAGMTGRQTQ